MYRYAVVIWLSFGCAHGLGQDDRKFNEEKFRGYGRKAPNGLFKNVNDGTIGNAILLRGTELFIDARLIASLQGVRRQLNRPVKHRSNPVLVPTKPWEVDTPGYGTVHYDAQAKQFKMWYQGWKKTKGTSDGVLYYATSKDGLNWSKPALDVKGRNIISSPPIQGFQCPGVFLDRGEQDPKRRYKMLFSCNPDGTSSSWMTSAAFSPDGIHWMPSSTIPLIPFSDTQVCPFWDARSQRYVAILRFGPPNTRIISRTESEDFLNWSPKITVLRRTQMDEVQQTQFYQMAPMPYGNGYLGIIGTYHAESLRPLPKDKPWTDLGDLQLAYSRDGVVWRRVGARGAMTHAEMNRVDRDWSSATRDATIVPSGRKGKDWDSGYISPYFTPEPIIINDRMYLFYAGSNDRHYWMYKGDPPMKDPNATPPKKGVGLATIRRDGFVSINAGSNGGTMTTRPFMFLGDTLLLNADAAKGSITIEALDSSGRTIEGFGRSSSVAITSDKIRHVISWKSQKDLHQLQGRPIRLRFHLKHARMFSISARTRNNHHVRAYD